MKATLNTQRTTPNIVFTSQGIEVNSILFHPAILLDASWTPIKIETSIQNWPNHPLRLDCLQIISWPNATPSTRILDWFWEKNIPVDILPLDMAIQQAKILEDTPYQLSVFNPG